MNPQTVMSVLGLLGLGGIISSYCTIIWQQRSANLQKKQDYKEVRYKCALQLMHGFLEGSSSIAKINHHGGRSFSTCEDIIEEVKNEWCSMILFASDDVLRNVQAYIMVPSAKTYFKAAISMRKDLWGGKLKFSADEIKFEIAKQDALN